ncbi:MAG: DUF2769 domain-containing protein [Candidatus Pacebacteria bacterium]|nr:DUF2769 domain-containing protein [Candidatus Paceibacterota bacterium]
MAVIDFTKENMEKCQCLRCPVQDTSECVKTKLENLKNLNPDILPDAQDFPGVYCANGCAYCEDLNREKECQCPTCGIWEDYGLGNATPSFKYCQNGKVDEYEIFEEDKYLEEGGNEELEKDTFER